MSRRTAAKIRAFLSEHVSRDEVDRVWRWEMQRAAATIQKIPGDLAAAIVAIPHPRDPGAILLLMEAHMHRVLTALADDRSLPPAHRRPRDPDLIAPPRRLGNSRSLAAARARGARLAAQMMNLRGRVGKVRLPR